MDDSFNGENIEDEDFPYLLDYMADRLEKSEAEDRDLVLEAVKQWQPSEDYFAWRHKSNTPKEYFYMDDTLKKKGVATFVAFINWLADKGYIADDNEVKTLFAYRLTGRCRPEGKDLPVIEWHGKNNKPYELIYIVRNFSDRGDYKKMRLFFQGPEWVKDSDSSYVNSADSEFRRKMAELYPGVCEFRK